MNSAEIILVRYGNPVFEERAIAAVREHTDLERHALTVVDNFERDRGLTAVWNQAISSSAKEFIVLLNSDTQVTAGWLDGMIAAAEKTGAEAVGPMTNHCSPPQQVGRPSAGTVEIGQLSGFCLLFRRSTWERLGGFREDVQFYGGESLFLRRLTKKVIAKSVYVHHEGGATVKLRNDRALEERASGKEAWLRNTRFDWDKRLAVIGSPESPFPLWQGINHAVKEFGRQGMTVRHFGYNEVHHTALKEFAPDVIVCVASRASIIHQIREVVKAFNVPRGLWFNDLRGPEEGKAIAGGFNAAFLCFQSAPGHDWNEWTAASRAKLFYMPQGSVVNPEVEPLDIQRELLFIGGTANSWCHQGRADICRQLGATVINETQREARIRVENQSRSLYRQSRFCLVMSPLIPGYNSLRLYNVMAHGGLPLVQRFPGLERLFEEGRHFIGWSTVGEAKEQMAKYREQPDECERIRKRAWRYQQSRHSVTNRLMNIVANLTANDHTFWGYQHN